MNKSKNVIDSCLECLTICEICTTDCINTSDTECALLCRDCADICSLCARFEARGSQFVYDLHDLCAEICKACAIECAKHAAHHNSFKECAIACKKCAAICEEFVSVNA